ncbi:MAG: cupin domain-containing protein [Candidatus ainarchaeum sp.]|nr:cupin domain-containing protein [Candidatus ainarchaeum sp.]
MLIKDLAKSKKFIAGDKTIFRSILHPAFDNVDLNYCIGEAALKPGKTSFWHRLKNSELYFILQGTGLMQIDEEAESVKSGQAVFIPANAKQRIKNTGKKSLVFLCIVSPAWKKEDEEVLE